jgi:hypothetical protein
MNWSKPSRLTTHRNLRGYFDQGVSNALEKQHIRVDDHTRVYLVNLLTHFADSRNLFDHTKDGLRIRALAEHYADAHFADHPREREMALRRLGDVALFVASAFSDSLSRRSVDLDYYIAMGGNAYGELARADAVGSAIRAAHQVFQQLAECFVQCMDVLAEVVRPSANERDILRLYEAWLRTGSQRAARRLRSLGIDPINGLKGRFSH